MSTNADKTSVRNFLLRYLEDPDYTDLLQWINKDEKTFRVLWLHAGRASFQRDKHQQLFVKYREYRGRKKADDPKQCFGMALKKSPAVQDLPRHTDDDWRYYQFTQPIPSQDQGSHLHPCSSSGMIHCNSQVHLLQNGQPHHHPQPLQNGSQQHFSEPQPPPLHAAPPGYGVTSEPMKDNLPQMPHSSENRGVPTFPAHHPQMPRGVQQNMPTKVEVPEADSYRRYSLYGACSSPYGACSSPYGACSQPLLPEDLQQVELDKLTSRSLFNETAKPHHVSSGSQNTFIPSQVKQEQLELAPERTPIESTTCFTSQWQQTHQQLYSTSVPQLIQTSQVPAAHPTENAQTPGLPYCRSLPVDIPYENSNNTCSGLFEHSLGSPSSQDAVLTPHSVCSDEGIQFQWNFDDNFNT